MNLSGPVNVYLTFSDPSGSAGNIKLDLFLACVPAGSLYNAALTFGTVLSTGSYSLTSTGGANTTKELTLAGLNIPAGCATHSKAQLLISRDNTVVGNSVDVLALMEVTFEYARI
jgi:hypothetical protein